MSDRIKPLAKSGNWLKIDEDEFHAVIVECERLQARNELLEKVVVAADLAAPQGVYGYDMDALDKLRKALAALKEQATPESTAPE